MLCQMKFNVYLIYDKHDKHDKPINIYRYIYSFINYMNMILYIFFRVNYMTRIYKVSYCEEFKALSKMNTGKSLKYFHHVL